MNNYNVISKNGKPVKTSITLHPGEILSEELEARNI